MQHLVGMLKCIPYRQNPGTMQPHALPHRHYNTDSEFVGGTNCFDDNDKIISDKGGMILVS
jgi:hypothetical protein